MPGNVRIDKWLWAVRIFKTRSQATEACRKGRIEMNELPVKPSREVHPGDIVKVKISSVTRSFKVLGIIEKRVSAKLLPTLSKTLLRLKRLSYLNSKKYELDETG